MAFAETVAAEAAATSGSSLITLLFSLVNILAFCCVPGLIFGFITRSIARKKGYSHGFVWGFFLGVIGLLVNVFRPDRNAQTSSGNLDTLERIVKLHEQGALTDEEFSKKKAELLEKI